MIDYREKYLKYKKKYLQAKNIYVGGCDPIKPIKLTINTGATEVEIEVSPTLNVSNREFRIELINMLGLDKKKYYTLSYGDDILYTFGQHEQHEQHEQQEQQEQQAYIFEHEFFQQQEQQEQYRWDDAVSLERRVMDMLDKKPIYTFGQPEQYGSCTFNDFGIEEDAYLRLQEVVSIQLNIETDVDEFRAIEVSPVQSVCNHEFWMNLIDEWEMDKNKYYALSFGGDILYTFGPNGQHFHGKSENTAYNDFGIEEGARLQLLESERAEITFILSDRSPAYREDRVRVYDNENITIYYPISLPLNTELFMYLLVVASYKMDGDKNKWKDLFGHDNWGEIYFIEEDDPEEEEHEIAALEVDTYWSENHKYIIYEGLMRTGG